MLAAWLVFAPLGIVFAAMESFCPNPDKVWLKVHVLYQVRTGADWPGVD